jgi:predicted O-methyltransferase YrrM
MVDFLSWIREHAKGQILEIGTREGVSTSAFLLGLEDKDPTGHLTSLDIVDCSHLWQHPQWTFHKANSLHAEFPDARFDIALIDGAHDRASFTGDLYNCYHWVKPGGLILVHDITPERGHEFYAVAIREEWDKFLRARPQLKHYILPGKYGMGVIER